VHAYVRFLRRRVQERGQEAGPGLIHLGRAGGVSAAAKRRRKVARHKERPAKRPKAERREAKAGKAASPKRERPWPERYLAAIERQGAGSAYEELYLWPRTPLTPDHQEIIARR